MFDQAPADDGFERRRLDQGRAAILTHFRPDVLYMYAKIGEKFRPARQLHGAALPINASFAETARWKRCVPRSRSRHGLFSEVVLQENVYPVTNARQEAFVVSAPAQIVKPE